MRKYLLACFTVFTSLAATAADLTATEMRWLKGAWPVITYAEETKLPLDIVVQPQPTPGQAPLALGFVDGRCKLVLSMRGNPEAEATLDRIAPELLNVTLELMAAHELGHCRRYLDGAWMGLPAGFTAVEPEGLSPELRNAYRNMKGTRREEGYGDLVGLAWTQQRHPEAYKRLHAWLLKERSKDLIPGSHHDTLAWVRLATDGRVLAGATPFAGADGLWKSGLTAHE
ncbi:MAG TPA: hypothetical protein VFY73_04270 [Ideonella sp.]|uniref:hypothetical protein n=1 Tax=Ideonella sp. TaxID=1929293 RepID=UPI002E378677|nr:hypothetical protein [Ideonella sp.]HEX5683231.1 hypothetical protein [Ideonella sp.]